MGLEVTCRAADTLPIDRLMDFQGSLKNISKGNLEKLKRRILKHGINAPIFVWDHEGDYYILDGHQRVKALNSLREDGYDMPMIPVAYIEAESKQDAKDKLLGITSQYGEFDDIELKTWIEETEGIDFSFDVSYSTVEGEEATGIKDVELKPYTKSHILISVDQNKYLEVANVIKQIEGIEGVEVEQGSN